MLSKPPNGGIGLAYRMCTLPQYNYEGQIWGAAMVIKKIVLALGLMLILLACSQVSLRFIGANWDAVQWDQAVWQ